MFRLRRGNKEWALVRVMDWGGVEFGLGSSNITGSGLVL